VERLGPGDYEAVLTFLRQLYGVERLEDFPRRAMAGLGRLIESDILTYNEIYPRRIRADFLDEPAGTIDDWQRATFERYAHQHPLITHYAKTRERHPRKISDFLTLTQFKNLALHSEFFRPLRLNYQMAVTIPSTPELVIGIALNRSRVDFSERDRSMLEAIRPHLAQAYRNAAERTRLAERVATVKRIELRSVRQGTPEERALTRREREVLNLVAEGKTNRQIGARLAISGRTVQKHLEHIYQKLRVRTRTAAAMKLASPAQPAVERSDDATVAGRATR
jgi:DNA-binding CsgD family transcriptional regulator